MQSSKRVGIQSTGILEIIEVSIHKYTRLKALYLRSRGGIKETNQPCESIISHFKEITGHEFELQTITCSNFWSRVRVSDEHLFQLRSRASRLMSLVELPTGLTPTELYHQHKAVKSPRGKGGRLLCSLVDGKVCLTRAAFSGLFHWIQ
uniref:Uncharacterized protein n=1 Tax=Timema tahoe TaxID=61484 RepID=A0A7R9FLP2_9NEOP|nr:unnamed protein product [Timema tahoe]